jgi:hypothetical protein
MATRKPSSVRRTSSRDERWWEDEILRDLYARRDAYSAAHGHDLKRIFADLKRRGLAVSTADALKPRRKSA